MLALPIALLLALPAGDALATEARTATEPSVPTGSLIPYGTAEGSWVAGTLYDDGVLVALMEDAAGRPVFVLDARLTPSGHIDGVLRPLEYATNPVLGMPALYVDGQAQITPEGEGTFEALIASPLNGAIPVYPFGKIEGVLLSGMRRADKPNALEEVLPTSSGVAATGVDGRKRIRGLLVHPGAPVQDGDLGGATSAGAASEIGARQAGNVIVCPKGPDFAISAATSAGAHGEIGGEEPYATVIVCPYEPKLSVSGTQSLGQVSAIGGGVSGTSGLVAGVSVSSAGQASSVSAGALAFRLGKADAGAHGEIGPGAVSYRFGKAPAGAHGSIGPGGTTTSNVEQGAAGAHRSVEPGVPASGEGRVRARWYLLP